MWNEPQGYFPLDGERGKARDVVKLVKPTNVVKPTVESELTKLVTMRASLGDDWRGGVGFDHTESPSNEIKYNIMYKEKGLLRDFVNDILPLFGYQYQFNFGADKTGRKFVEVVLGMENSKISGYFFFDGEVWFPDENRYRKVAQNIDGQLTIERSDFYKAMGLNYKTFSYEYAITEAGNVFFSVVAGALSTAITKNLKIASQIVAGGASTLGASMVVKSAGIYRVDSILVYLPDKFIDLSHGIVTSHEYFKSPMYQEFAKEPSESWSYYDYCVIPESWTYK